MREVLTRAGELVFCPYHGTWEVYVGEDPALCEWCCMLFPCPMHGDGSLSDNGDFIDPFRREMEIESEENKWTSRRTGENMAAENKPSRTDRGVRRRSGGVGIDDKPPRAMDSRAQSTLAEIGEDDEVVELFEL